MFHGRIQPHPALPLNIGDGGTFEPCTEAATFYAACTVKPVRDRYRLIDRTIRRLKDAGVWSKLDALYLSAAADSQIAGLNWVNPGTNTLTAVSSPAFAADRGYTGNASTSYLSTNYNPGDGGSHKFLQNDAHFGGYIGTNVAAAAGKNDFGTTSDRIKTKSTASVTVVRMNTTVDNNDSYGTDMPSSGIGHFAVTRAASGAYTPYWNGVAQTAVSQASAALANLIFFLCAENTLGSPTNFSDRRISAFHAGGDLGAGMTSLRAAVVAYLTAVGAPT